MIDDVGYSFERAREIMDLPGRVTLGVLPYAPHARAIAEAAQASGTEVILHQPMEPLPEATTPPVPGTLTVGMTPERFDAQFHEALAEVPYAVGVNNHTGSLLTARRAPMDLLMANIQRRGLFFLDSRTTASTVAEATAREWRVPTVRRDVFLDNVPTRRAMARQFARALGVARQRGAAVVIAHPYPATVRFLEEILGNLPPDVQLASLAGVVERILLERTPAVRMLAAAAREDAALARASAVTDAVEPVRQPGRTALARLESREYPRRSPGQ